MIHLIFFLLILVLFWLLIYPCTDYYVRFLARTVIKKGKIDGKKICLSFDDGPDPFYTPLLLTILKENQTRAAFFLIGAKAEKAPELVRRIIAERHEIGVHTFYHKHAYLMFFKRSLDNISKGIKALEKITNQSLIWFRPPWGALNLFEFLYLRRLKLNIVLWSANAADWDIKTGVAGILNNLRKRVGPNSIIVLHDSGGDSGAPRNMLQALPELIVSLKKEGFQFVTLSEITGRITLNDREKNITEIK